MFRAAKHITVNSLLYLLLSTDKKEVFIKMSF